VVEPEPEPDSELKWSKHYLDLPVPGAWSPVDEVACAAGPVWELKADRSWKMIDSGQSWQVRQMIFELGLVWCCLRREVV
jgi:hypothetical protein